MHMQGRAVLSTVCNYFYITGVSYLVQNWWASFRLTIHNIQCSFDYIIGSYIYHLIFGSHGFHTILWESFLT